MSFQARSADIEQLSERLRAHVGVLARDIGERNVWRPAALAAAQAYIAAQWQQQGYAVAAQRYTTAGVDSANLEIAIAGASQSDEIIVVGAHYDSVQGSPGADDNASAVAALIELPRLLAGVRPARTLRLVAFVNEEPPFFFWGDMGSGVYAKAARRRGDDIHAMFSLEMLGCYSEARGSQRYPPLLRRFYPDCGNFIAFVSNLRSRRLLKQAVAAFRRHSDFPAESAALPAWVPGVAWSDQLSFWRQGYRAVMVTDTAFYRYPYYHTALDTPERLDYGRLAAVTDGLARAFVELAADASL
ncbi:MAG: M28 family peptidase [Burkholderiales bacterium]